MKRERTVTAAAMAALLAMNAWIVARLFKTEYTPWMSSIEGAYFGLSRWIQGHWTDLGWYPQWYAGVPFENSYPPLLHVLVAAFGQLTGVSVARAHHVVTGAFYCLGPVALFWLVVQLSGSRWKALIAGWLYSLVSFSAFLMPSVTRDMGNAWEGRRIQALMGYGEGPHVSSMTLMTFALAAIHAALERPSGWRMVVAAAATAATALTNWHGAFALGCGVLALVLARPRVRILRVTAIGLLAYALSAPWIRPSTVATVRRNAELLGGYAMKAPQYLYLAVWLGSVAAVGLLLRRTRLGVAERFALLFLALMAVPPLGWEWFHKAYPLPQASRYHLEMELAIALGAGLLLGAGRGVTGRWATGAVAAGLALLTWTQVPVWRHYSRIHLDAFDITSTLEYQAAHWLETHLPGQRVFALGSTQFWLNAFGDSPQFGGGFAQARANPMIDEVTFAVSARRGDGAGSADLLKAYGVRAVVVGGEHSRNVYRDYQDPGKFAGVLPEVWRDGDDAIYAVPARTGSLAHVMQAPELTQGSLLDPEQLRRFVAALDDPRYEAASFQWTGAGRARVEAAVKRGQVVSVQVNWHAGWRAAANGKRCAVRRDGLGLLVVEPECDGKCGIDLTYDGGAEGMVARVLCGLGLLVCAGLVAGRRSGAWS